MAKRPASKAKSKVKARGKTTAKPVAKVKKAAKPAAKAAKRAVLKAKPKAAKTLTVMIPQMINLTLPPALHDRLKDLSQVMGLSTEGVIRQALMEFCDTWEDHHRTVSALAETHDRMQIVQKD
eukprot:TRINITY_DN68613_c0_g1_i1.p1 TRINITY_DN68613_c0_g1~~TRINITY_DN68613_c0_g1_i1.p1  ORF type:complete len:123 (+),score=25.95 TRINITY_DN68613_c0_g1_i1:93-461(+)